MFERGTRSQDTIAVLQQFPVIERVGILYLEHFICLYFVIQITSPFAILF